MTRLGLQDSERGRGLPRADHDRDSRLNEDLVRGTPKVLEVRGPDEVARFVMLQTKFDPVHDFVRRLHGNAELMGTVMQDGFLGGIISHGISYHQCRGTSPQSGQRLCVASDTHKDQGVSHV